MWKEIKNEKDAAAFMSLVYDFHDSCIKEMKYVSGAYVDDDLSMYPLNDQRKLSVIIQRQDEENTVIELEFSKLKYLRLCPINEEYTCEILDSRFFFKDGSICWRDSGDGSDIENADGCNTVICAGEVRWRVLRGCLGGKVIYSDHNNE